MTAANSFDVKIGDLENVTKDVVARVGIIEKGLGSVGTDLVTESANKVLASIKANGIVIGSKWKIFEDPSAAKYLIFKDASGK